MLKVAFIFGGVSSEHDISALSAASILENLDRTHIDPIAIGITRLGGWYVFTGDTESIRNGTWESDHLRLTKCILSPDREHHGIFLCTDEHSKYSELIRLDAVFPVLHGKNGEDGAIQGLLQLSGIPFVGCDMTASASCMDKHITKLILQNVGISVADWLVLDKKYDVQEVHKNIVDSFGYPAFVKPSKSGSSVGVSRVACEDELKSALELAFAEDNRVLIEQSISGAEVECAVMGYSTEPVTSTVLGEIEPTRELYDFEGKYKDSSTTLHIPARLDADRAQLVRDTAAKAYRAVGCNGLSRVDFFVTDTAVILNEINTLPGFTSISMFPKLFIESGISYSETITRLIDYAIKSDVGGD